MQGNVIKSTKGLQLLRGLEELDLRCNLIASIHEVVRLSGNHTQYIHFSDSHNAGLPSFIALCIKQHVTMEQCSTRVLVGQVLSVNPNNLLPDCEQWQLVQKFSL